MKVYVPSHGPVCSFDEPCLTCQVENFLRLSLDEVRYARYRELLNAALVEIPDSEKTDVLDIPIMSLGQIGSKGPRQLVDIGIQTVRDLLKYSEADLRASGCSNYLLKAINSRLVRLGLALRRQ